MRAANTLRATEDEAPAAPARPSTATSRPLWIGGYVLLCLVLLVRLPVVHRGLREQVPPEMAAELGDESMLALALRVATLLAFLVYPFVLAFVFWVAATFERHLFPVPLTVGGRRVGLYFATVVLCAAPPQLVWFATGATTPDRGPLAYAYLAAVAVALCWLYRAGLRRCTPARAALVVLTALITGCLVAVG